MRERSTTVMPESGPRAAIVPSRREVAVAPSYRRGRDGAIDEHDPDAAGRPCVLRQARQCARAQDEDSLLMAQRKMPHPELGAKRHVEGRTVTCPTYPSRPLSKPPTSRPRD